MTGRKWTEAEIQFLIENYSKAESITEIALKINRSWEATRARANSLGLYIDQKTYECDETCFDVITNQSCYWGGFIAADGCISKNYKKYNLVTLCQMQEEVYKLEEFCEFVKYNGPIQVAKGKYNKNGSFTKPMCRVAITSQHMVDSLNSNFNITPKKSLTLLAPNTNSWTIENKLSFIAGVIDGDGCVSFVSKRNRLTICITGTESLLQFFLDTAREILPPDAFIQDNPDKGKYGNYYNARICGSKAYCLGLIILKLDIPLSMRKWDKIYKFKLNTKYRSCKTIQTFIDQNNLI